MLHGAPNIQTWQQLKTYHLKVHVKMLSTSHELIMNPVKWRYHRGLSLVWPHTVWYHKHDIRESGVKMGLAPLIDTKIYI